MSAARKKEEIFHHQKWLLELLGEGRRRYFLLGLLTIISMSSVVLGVSFFFVPKITLNLVVGIVLIGLVLNSIISLRLQYWRDNILWQVVSFMTFTAECFIIGFTMVLNGHCFSTFAFVFTSVLLSIFLMFRGVRREIGQLELARRKGFLGKYLDEESWTYDDDPTNASGFWYALQRARGEEKAKSLVKWLRRLEKLHYLIPGIAILLRRALGHEEIILGILLISMGLLFFNLLLSFGFSYRKIREWEQERGKPILLRFVWEKKQRQSVEKQSSVGKFHFE